MVLRQRVVDCFWIWALLNYLVLRLRFGILGSGVQGFGCGLLGLTLELNVGE